jgi:hypothetical protein
MQDIKKKQTEGAPIHKGLKRNAPMMPLYTFSSGIHESRKGLKRLLYRLKTPFVAVFLQIEKKESYFTRSRDAILSRDTTGAECKIHKYLLKYKTKTRPSISSAIRRSSPTAP